MLIALGEAPHARIEAVLDQFSTSAEREFANALQVLQDACSDNTANAEPLC
ncbi:MAG: hypothetical protein ACI9DC_005284 [Gammaproteobacteria bacterium]|jgi:hypothetical protein